MSKSYFFAKLPAAGATLSFLYVGVVGEDRHIVMIHVGIRAGKHLTIRLRENIVKRRKAKNPIDYPNEDEGWEKQNRGLKKSWMIRLQESKAAVLV